jgi:hypothetical protein
MAMAKVQNAAVNHYNLINKGWDEVTLSPPTGLEAITAAKILWASEGLRWHWPVQLVSGNRHTWVRRGTCSINPNRCGQGWSELVHDLSHLAHNRKNRKWDGSKPRPHCFDQAKIERRMQRLVINKLAK